MVRDAMTDYEAMRIDQDRDPIVTDQVMRRFLATGADPARRQLPPGRRRTGATSWAGAAEMQSLAAQVVRAGAPRASSRRSGSSSGSLEALAGAAAASRWCWSRRGSSRTRACSGFRRAVSAGAPRERGRLLPRRARARGRHVRNAGRSVAAARPRRPQHGRGHRRDRASASEGSEGLALDTGGFVLKNRNDLGGGPRPHRAARRAATTSSATRRPNRAADGRFRKIEVKVARAGRDGPRAARLLRARGARREGREAEARDAAIQRALDAPFDLPEVPLRAIAQVVRRGRPRASTVVLVTVGGRHPRPRVRREGRHARDTLEFLLLVARRGHRRVHPLRPAVRDALPAGDARAVRARPGSRSRASSRSRPARYQAKVVARDRNSGRVGEPDPRLRGARPRASRLEPGAERPASRGAPRRARAGARRAAQLRARGHCSTAGSRCTARRTDPATRPARSDRGLRRSAGATARSSSPPPRRPSGPARTARSPAASALPLDGAPAGPLRADRAS